MRTYGWFRWIGALLLLLIAAMQDVSAKDEQWDSKLIPQGITLTGKRADFPPGTLAMLEQQQASFGLCNDTQYLYVMLAFRNPMSARVIRRSGLTIWLDAAGKKGKDFLIKYTGGPTREQMITLRRQEASLPERQMDPEMQQRMDEMDTGFTSQLLCFQKDRISEKAIPLDGSEGPSAVFGIDQGFCVYEFRIPLQESRVRYYGLGTKQGTKITVGFMWGEPLQGERGSRMEFGGGTPGGEGMRPPDGWGGGPREGGGPGGPGGMRGMQRMGKQEVWIKSKLGVSGN
ncbi:hypothetical protein C3F09_10285 [candidate division GN15 bacterium]|uniref:Uncharacterized protein n=1 Tax=candidate division GN15 bacterium TaxID=2072418 RepID=A0A855WWV2_9BACT|nr:MAG: hypothetical protein C3F09_10285 [candidate division GN15 bacterium]